MRESNFFKLHLLKLCISLSEVSSRSIVGVLIDYIKNVDLYYIENFYFVSFYFNFYIKKTLPFYAKMRL